MISPPQVVLLFWKAIKEDGTYSKRLCQMVKKDGVKGQVVESWCLVEGGTS